ncbi:hypothetical protein PInf_000078 [Phytophthora infestans]|nr:hypothetical protein PInf_000078 [Phytophthora infestans]
MNHLTRLQQEDDDNSGRTTPDLEEKRCRQRRNSLDERDPHKQAETILSLRETIATLREKLNGAVNEQARLKQELNVARANTTPELATQVAVLTSQLSYEKKWRQVLETKEIRLRQELETKLETKEASFKQELETKEASFKQELETKLETKEASFKQELESRQMRLDSKEAS